MINRSRFINVTLALCVAVQVISTAHAGDREGCSSLETTECIASAACTLAPAGEGPGEQICRMAENHCELFFRQVSGTAEQCESKRTCRFVARIDRCGNSADDSCAEIEPARCVRTASAGPSPALTRLSQRLQGFKRLPIPTVTISPRSDDDFRHDLRAERLDLAAINRHGKRSGIKQQAMAWIEQRSRTAASMVKLFTERTDSGFHVDVDIGDKEVVVEWSTRF